MTQELHFVIGNMNQLELNKEENSKLKFRRRIYTFRAGSRLAYIAVAADGGIDSAGNSSSGPGGHVSKACGSVSVIGRRKAMEDTIRVELGFLSGKKMGKLDFFGVYDGHGGNRVAEACKERMHVLVAEEIARLGPIGAQSESLWRQVMEEAFGKMDEEVGEFRMVGSTAVVAVVGPGELVVANCGDSRAVLSRAGAAVPLSVDHKPDREDECGRIEAAGGKVINWNGQRIFGVLATSRSIGDDYLKPFVISKPDVTVVKRSKNDEFLIIASDGLWDVMSSDVACKIGRKFFKKYGQKMSATSNTASELAVVLAKLAAVRGSSDNISVIVVDLMCHDQ